MGTGSERVCLSIFEAENSRKDPGTSEETIPEGQAGVVKATGRR
jgi:hypothetical protein